MRISDWSSYVCSSDLAGLARRLPSRGLALAGRQHAAHQHFRHILAVNPGLRQRGADRGGAELVGGHAGQCAGEAAQRRADGGCTDDGIGVAAGGDGGHGGSPCFLLPEDKDDRYHLSAKRYLRRSEEHTSELQSLMRISYDVFCLT